MPLNAHVTKEERSEISHPSFLLRKLEKKEQIKSEEKKQELEQESMKLKIGSQ